MRIRVFLVCLSWLAFSHAVRAQQVILPLDISEADATIHLRVGIDPSATNGHDAAFGEEELPPPPPLATFDARLVDLDLPRSGLGEGGFSDFVEGDSTCNCQRQYELRLQSGSGALIGVSWSFPDGVTGLLQDTFGGAVYAESISGSGGTVIPNTALDRILLTIDYTRLVNDVPQITSEPILTGKQDEPYSYVLQAEDADLDSLVFSPRVIPGWLTLTGISRTSAALAGMPGNEDVGDQLVAVDVSDGDAVVSQEFVIAVENVNDPPSFLDGRLVSLRAVEDSLFSFTARAVDLDGDTLSFAISPALPAWATASDSSSNAFTISGTPTEADIGASQEYLLIASDVATTDTLSILIDYESVNDPPSIPQILSPADGSEVLLEGDPTKPIKVIWSDVTDSDGPSEVSFVWSIGLDEDFSGGTLTERNTDSLFVAFLQSDLVTVVDNLGLLPGQAIPLWHRVAAFDGELYSFSDAVQLRLVRGAITETDAAAPLRFAVYPSYPNPSSAATTIRYDLAEPSSVRIEVFDVLGRQVFSRTSTQSPGRHKMSLDVSDLGAGLYVYEISAGSNAAAQHFVVAR